MKLEVGIEAQADWIELDLRRGPYTPTTEREGGLRLDDLALALAVEARKKEGKLLQGIGFCCFGQNITRSSFKPSNLH